LAYVGLWQYSAPCTLFVLYRVSGFLMNATQAHLGLAPNRHARQFINLLVSGGHLGRPFIASAAVPPRNG